MRQLEMEAQAQRMKRITEFEDRLDARISEIRKLIKEMVPPCDQRDRANEWLDLVKISALTGVWKHGFQ